MVSYLEIGQIVNTYGIKGFLKVVPYTDDNKRFERLKTVYIEQKGKKTEIEIEEVKYSKNLVLLKLKGIDSIEEAEKYKNATLKIDRKNAVELPENTYFMVDLLGLSVYTEEGENVGEVEDIFKTGSNDVYVVKDALGKQILLPAIQAVIKEIDIKNGKIIVHLLEGLKWWDLTY